MYALPGQTIEGALADIDTAISFGPEHVSAYHLTLEPNTYFYRFPPKLPSDDLIAGIEQQARAMFSFFGYERYEVSAFAAAGEQSRHNLNYWLFGDYIGIGAGAHGKLSLQTQVFRSQKPKHPQAYMDWVVQNKLPEQETLDQDRIVFEFLLNALRLHNGFSLEHFENHTGLSRDQLLPQLQIAVDQSLIEVGTSVKTTPRGYEMLDSLLQMFLPT